MPREYCKSCSYPLTTCVCHAINQIELPLSVVVIQHHKEISHAKNTVRLAKLVSPCLQIIDARDSVSISKLSNQTDANTILLYPNENSRSLEEFADENVTLGKSIDQLILIDGTWKQAHGIWKRYRLDEHLPSVHFSNSVQKTYKIRASKKGFQLSTLEALAYSVSVLTKLDVSPYHNILDAMQAHWPEV